MIGRPCILALAACFAVVSTAFAAGQAVQLRSSDGVTLAATLYDAAEASAPGVVLVHMFTRSKDDWRSLGERLQTAGVAALAIDLRGHGASAGPATPSTAMAQDVLAGVGYLQGRAAGRPIAIVGASLGASLGAIAAGDTPAVRGLALVSPAADYRGVRLEAAIRKYGNRPMLLLASADDPYAVRTIRDLTENATGREQHLSPVVAHGTRLLERDPDLTTTLVDWLRRTLLS